VSFDHPAHGFLFPAVDGGAASPDQIQQQAIDQAIAFLDRHMKPGG
jgi:hypothetical protein